MCKFTVREIKPHKYSSNDLPEEAIEQPDVELQPLLPANININAYEYVHDNIVRAQDLIRIVYEKFVLMAATPTANGSTELIDWEAANPGILSAFFARVQHLLNNVRDELHVLE